MDVKSGIILLIQAIVRFAGKDDLCLQQRHNEVFGTPTVLTFHGIFLLKII